MPVNNNSPLFNTRRIIKELPKIIIEKEVEKTIPEVVVAETLKQADEDLVSFFDLDYKGMLNMNNIQIISQVGENGTNSTADLIKSLDGKTFDSYDDLLSVIADNSDIQIITLSIDDVATYKVGNDSDGWATVYVNVSQNENAHVPKDYNDNNQYIFPTNDIYTINDLKSIYKLSDEQISFFFVQNGEEYTIKQNLSWNGEKINDFSELFIKLDKEYSKISASLKEQGFSKEFITYLLQYVKENAQIEEQDGENFDVSKIFEKYNNEIEQYTSNPELDYQILLEEAREMYNPKTGESTVIPAKYGNIFDKNLCSLLINLDELSSSQDPQIKLFVSMFKDVFDKLELNPKEQNVLIKNILENIVDKLGIERIYQSVIDEEVSDVTYLSIKISDISTLNTNNDTWFDELYNIINEEASKIKVVDRNPSQIDAEALLGDKNELTAVDIYNGLFESNNVLSDDGGVRKFYELISGLRSKFLPGNKFDEMDLIKCAINLINRELGIDGKTITVETVEKLNQQEDLFAKLEEILNSEDLVKLYYEGVDGEIDTFGQGGTGDCWLVASIISISVTNPQLIKDAITQDDDGTIHITFAGVGISYDISPEEMVEAYGYYYSNGDNDVLAFELAVEKLFRDIDNGMYSDLGISSSHSEEYMGKTSGLLGSNVSDILPYLLTGRRSLSCSGEKLANFVSDFNNGNMVVSLTMFPGAKATTINGEQFEFGGDVGSLHAFAVVGMTEDSITIVNPWNSKKEYTFSWEEFEKLRCDIDINFVFEKDEDYALNLINNVLDDKLSFYYLNKLNNEASVTNLNFNSDMDLYEFDYNGQHYVIKNNRDASDIIITNEDLDKYFEASSLTPEEKQKIIDLYFLPRCIIDGNTTHYQMKNWVTLDNLKQMIEVMQGDEVKNNIDIVQTSGIESLMKMGVKNLQTAIAILLMTDGVKNLNYYNDNGQEGISFDYDGVTYSIVLNKEQVNTDVVLTYNELMQYFENKNISEFDAYCLILEYFSNVCSRSDSAMVGYLPTGFIFALQDGKTFEDFLNAIENY